MGLHHAKVTFKKLIHVAPMSIVYPTNPREAHRHSLRKNPRGNILCVSCVSPLGRIELNIVGLEINGYPSARSERGWLA